MLNELGVPADDVQNVDLNKGSSLEGSKVLGMFWNTQLDVFHFDLNFERVDTHILTGARKPSKREVLRTLMLIFDPLGLMAWFLVTVKILLQDIWRSAIQWDQMINDEQHIRWMKWVKLLPSVKNIQIPRCHFTYAFNSLQLHVFVDASDSAIAAVAYFRFESASNVTCSLISAKTKVAPLQLLSIPRLELQAAVLGARLSNSLRSAHTIKPGHCYLWSDSTNVLSWLRSDHKKYRQYVAFRVSEIVETTNIADWRWVPTKHNVADDATKSKEVSESSINRWYFGPDFLRLPEQDWPAEPQHHTQLENSEETEPQMSHIIAPANCMSSILENYSSWRKVYRILAWVLRYKNNLQNPDSKAIGVLTTWEIKRAKSKCYRHAQLEVYNREIAQLEQTPPKPIDKSSQIYKSSPILDEFGVLRMKGRTGKAPNATYDMINPILLPRHHRVTHLIATHYHEKYLHLHKETAVNEIRQHYVIPQLRVLMNNISTHCQSCKIQRALPNPPMMADHPVARLAIGARPFSYVGIDYFGPLEVVVGRRVEKRWGCLFSCLTVRAIHIEIAHSLSMSSCMMCIRNFISRRGHPIEIRTDNGTNFIGVRNELQQIVYQIPLDKIKERFDSIKWVLNPPSAPHMGGCWERQIQSVKRCLEVKMPTRRPNDENLRCYLLEIECIMNSRPLTYMPIEFDAPEALTPNHFLIGSSGGIKPFCEFDDSVYTLKQNYQLSQNMALHFWKRWLKEYLPTLTRRTKWYKRADPIKVGDLVVIFDEGRRNSWMKGIITETTPGRNDDHVRRVTVNTTSGIYIRPATKVAVLDVEGHNSKPLHLSQAATTYQDGECCERSSHPNK